VQQTRRTRCPSLNPLALRLPPRTPLCLTTLGLLLGDSADWIIDPDDDGAAESGGTAR